MKLIKWLVHTMWRLALLPFKVVFAAMGISFKVGTQVAVAPVKIGARATRAAGVTGIIFFIVGLLLGLLLAPFSGKDMRAILLAKFGGGAPPTDDELAETVTFELSHAPRTWHLPQPDVYVTAGRAQLHGSVPDDEARDELLRVATAIPGVVGVDDLLEVEAARA